MKITSSTAHRPVDTSAPGLYVHVPFCAAKCAYCDFYSLPLAETGNGGARYLAGLDRELARLPDGWAPRTVFIGGGTPTALAEADLARLLSVLQARVDLSRVVEWTCEANPGTLDHARAERLHEAGVNRVSLGAQTFRPDLLQALGRMHGPEDIPESFSILRRAGIENLSADLMFGLPDQTPDRFAADIETLLALDPRHVSIYALSIEDGTPLAGRRAAGRWPEPDDDVEAEQYERATRMLTEAGWPPYEISNFARPGFECLHNQGYWDGTPYIGVGPAAHSYGGGVRWGNPPDLDAWASALERGKPTYEFEERLEPDAAAREALILALRTTEGVDSERFRARTGLAPETLRPAEIERFLGEGLLERTAQGFRLAHRARFISNTVFRALV